MIRRGRSSRTPPRSEKPCIIVDAGMWPQAEEVAELLLQLIVPRPLRGRASPSPAAAVGARGPLHRRAAPLRYPDGDVLLLASCQAGGAPQPHAVTGPPLRPPPPGPRGGAMEEILAGALRPRVLKQGRVLGPLAARAGRLLPPRRPHALGLAPLWHGAGVALPAARAPAVAAGVVHAGALQAAAQPELSPPRIAASPLAAGGGGLPSSRSQTQP